MEGNNGELSVGNSRGRSSRSRNSYGAIGKGGRWVEGNNGELSIGDT